MIDLHGDVQAGKQHGQHDGGIAQHTQKTGECIALVVILCRLEIFGQYERHRNDGRRAVDDDRHAPLEHFGSRDIRLFGGAALSENAVRVVGNRLLHVIAVVYRVDANFVELLPHAVDDFGVDDARQIDDRHRRIRLPSQLEAFDLQRRRFQSPLQKAEIGLDVLDKAFARAACHRFGRRFGDGAGRVGTRGDLYRLETLDQKNRIALYDRFFGRFVGNRLALGRRQHGRDRVVYAADLALVLLERHQRGAQHHRVGQVGLKQQRAAFSARRKRPRHDTGSLVQRRQFLYSFVHTPILRHKKGNYEKGEKASKKCTTLGRERLPRLRSQ